MGFLKTIELNNGLSVVDAYHRIHSVSGTKEEISIVLVAYKSQKDFLNDNEIAPLLASPHSFKADVTDEAANFFKQGYEHLKSLEMYMDVTDVLEEGQVL